MSNPSGIMPNEDDYIDYSRVQSGEKVDVNELSQIVRTQMQQDILDIAAGMKTIIPVAKGEK